MIPAHGTTQAWLASTPNQPFVGSARRPRSQPSAQTARANAAMLRYAQGDDAAFTELYHLLAPRLLRLCRSLSAADASELCQEVFIKIHRARAAYVDSASVFAWSAAIARKTHVDRIRYRARRPETALPSFELERHSSPGAHSPEAPLLHRELEVELERDLGLLSDKLRVAYALVKLHGQSYADASLALGTPVDALKQRVHRASEEIKANVALFLDANRPAGSPPRKATPSRRGRALPQALRAGRLDSARSA